MISVIRGDARGRPGALRKCHWRILGFDSILGQPSLPYIDARLKSQSKDPKLFNSAQADPILLLQYLKHRPILEVLTPMQLHCELSVNIFLNHLRRVCPQSLAKFLESIGLPVEPERYDYNGNQCRKVVKNWTRLQKLLPPLSKVKEKRGDDEVPS